MAEEKESPTPTPPTPPEVCGALEPTTAEYFRTWRTHLETKLKENLPDVRAENNAAFMDALVEIDKATAAWQGTAAETPARKQAQKVLYDLVDKLEREIALDVLRNNPEIQHILSDEYKDAEDDLITWKTLSGVSDDEWARWCSHGDEATRIILGFLNDVNLQRRILVSTSNPYKPAATSGRYWNALDKYNKLRHDPDIAQHEILERLAFACAFRLCGTEVTNFGRPGLVDPLQRYESLKEAYLQGELDPIFPRLSDFELRLVVDNSASEEDVLVGRETVYNYRPGVAISQDPKWRYNYIVKSDVPHRTPTWFKDPAPRTFDQILSGGGRCGPRAWYGRFICKSFGVPTWGVKQHGHAAMARWTVHGWDQALGAGFPWNYWDEMSGIDFLWQTRARAAVGSNDAYFQKVCRLEIIGDLYNEPNKLRHQVGQGRGLDFMVPASTSPWWALSMTQRVHLSRENKKAWGSFIHPKPPNAPRTRIEQLMSRPDCSTEPITRDDQDGGTIIIPGGTVTKIVKGYTPPCFTGGKQMFLNPNGSATYTIPADVLSCADTTRYELTCLVTNVHVKDEGWLVAFNGNPAVHIPVPYTMGKWEETTPVLVDVGDATKPTTMLVTRKTQDRALAVKYFKLTPLSS